MDHHSTTGSLRAAEWVLKTAYSRTTEDFVTAKAKAYLMQLILYHSVLGEVPDAFRARRDSTTSVTVSGMTELSLSSLDAAAEVTLTSKPHSTRFGETAPPYLTSTRTTTCGRPLTSTGSPERRP